MYLDMIYLLVFLSFSSLFSETAPCQDGDLRLVGSFTLEGRLEICFKEKWGTVCDDRWDEADATVACRQLGFSDSGSEALTGSYIEQHIGPGEGPIWLDEVNCSGNEETLKECRNVTHDCSHVEDAGIRCRHKGKPILVFNKTIYPNNSMIKMEDITADSSFVNTLQCITDRYPCCNDPDEAVWVEPNNVAVPLQSNFLQEQTSYQTVLLSRYDGIFSPNGVFHCRIRDSFNVTHQLYVGLYLDGLGAPIITSLKYNRANQTLTCLSTGGPTTNVTWRKDGIILTGAKCKQSQVIVDTTSASYENNLTLSKEEYGIYSCIVENNRGNSYAELAVKACTDGEAVLSKYNRQVQQICYNGTYHRVESCTNSSNAISIFGALIGILIASLLIAIVISITIHWNFWRLRKDSITVHEQAKSVDMIRTTTSCTHPSAVTVSRKFEPPRSSTDSMTSNVRYNVVIHTLANHNDYDDGGRSIEDEDNYDVIREVDTELPDTNPSTNLSYENGTGEEDKMNGVDGPDGYDNNLYEYLSN